MLNGYRLCVPLDIRERPKMSYHQKVLTVKLYLVPLMYLSIFRIVAYSLMFP